MGVKYNMYTVNQIDMYNHYIVNSSIPENDSKQQTTPQIQHPSLLRDGDPSVNHI